ncbi:MAG: hypothetical protein WCJ95_16145 [Mariniphaga sp.]
MKARIELTESQVNLPVATDEKQLRSKFEKDLASIRKKYEFIKIDTQQDSRQKQTEMTKLTDELFNQCLSQGLSAKEISINSGYNIAYVHKIRKRLIDEKLKNQNQKSEEVKSTEKV